MQTNPRNIATLFLLAAVVTPAIAGDSSTRQDNTSGIGDRTVPRVLNSVPRPNDICQLVPSACQEVILPPPPPPVEPGDQFVGANISCSLSTTQSSTQPLNGGTVSCSMNTLKPMINRTPTFKVLDLPQAVGDYSFSWVGCTKQADPSQCVGAAGPAGSSWEVTAVIRHKMTGQTRSAAFYVDVFYDDISNCPTFDPDTNTWRYCP